MAAIVGGSLRSFSPRIKPWMAASRSLEPASLQWQEDGELAAHDLFALVCRLRDVETAEHSNELWRLGHKTPALPQAATQAASADG